MKIKYRFLSLGLLYIFSTLLITCHRLYDYKSNNLVSNDLTNILLRPISLNKSMNDLYPYHITDLTKYYIDNVVTDSNNDNLYIKTSEDAEENSYLLRFNPKSGNIDDISNPFHDLGSYEGMSQDLLYFLVSKASTLTIFSKSNLKEISKGDHLFQNVFFTSNRIIATHTTSLTPEGIVNHLV